MTTIAGAVAGGKVFLAADQQNNDVNGYASLDGNKIFRKGYLLLGIAGDYKAANTLPWLPTGKFKYESEPRKFMTMTFPRLVREFAEQHEFVFDPFEALVGTKGMLFHYSSDDESVAPMGQFYAIGSGGPFALGSLATSERSVSVTNRLRLSVEIGIRYDSQSGGEVEVLSV